jgi:hypothetical protein
MWFDNPVTMRWFNDVCDAAARGMIMLSAADDLARERRPTCRRASKR